MNVLQKAVLYVARSLGLTDPRLYQHLGSRESYSGESVSASSVLGLSAAWACINLLAGTIASLPLMVYRTKGDVRTVAADHPLYRILHDSPNADQTALEFWEFICACLELQGNGFSEIERGGDGRIISLAPPIAPDLMTVERLSSGALEYRWSDNGKTYRLPEDRVLHFRGFGGSPLGGLSTLAFGRQAFGLAQAVERSAAQTFANGIRTTGVLKLKETLRPEQRLEVEENLHKKHAGAINAGVPMVLDRAMEWQQLSINPNDAQMLESRSFSVEEVCRFFGVPPFMVGHTEKTTSWGTGLSEQVMGFQKFTLRKRLKRLEQAMEKKLLTVKDRLEGISIEFNLEGLLRGDSTARSAFYQSALSNGWMTINEVRRLENLPPVPGGDEPRMQMQNVPITGAPGIGDNGGPPLEDDE
jgi:HK97 family phage portal protein